MCFGISMAATYPCLFIQFKLLSETQHSWYPIIHNKRITIIVNTYDIQLSELANTGKISKTSK